jgi:two-component system, NarL family, sensor kinase
MGRTVPILQDGSSRDAGPVRSDIGGVSWSWRARFAAPAAALALSATLGGTLLGYALGPPGAAGSMTAADALLVAAYLSLPASGTLLLWRRPANDVGWLLSLSGLLAGTYLAAHGWAGHALRTDAGRGADGGTVAAWLATWLLIPTFGLLPIAIAAFPHGRATGPVRRATPLAAVAIAALALAQALAPEDVEGYPPSMAPIANPLGTPALRGPISAVTGLAGAALAAFALLVIVDLVHRTRQATGDERRALRAVVAFPALVPLTILAGVVLPRDAGDVVIAAGQIVALLGMSTALAIAVLRYRLYDLGDYLRRSATYVALSGAVVVAIVAVASLVAVVAPVDGVAPAAIAAALVAVGLGPLRVRGQRAIDRLLFGRRDDPFDVLASVAGTLELAPDEDGAVVDAVHSLAAALRLPYVAVLDLDGTLRGSTGRPVTPTVQVALVHGHRSFGTLVAGQRSADEPFGPGEVALLHQLARQLAATLQARAAGSELQQARVELVRGREDERRRLRRDLHDGLGPMLAGTLLHADTLRAELADRPEAALLAGKVTANLRAMVEDVRRVVHDLRPPALDELGLFPALREQVAAITGAGDLRVTVELEGDPAAMSAAVEVAVYRIVSEAVTNVVRHACATACSVRVVVAGGVDLTVEDDGIGLDERAVRLGIGLRSMRERAAELGGELGAERREPRGTRIRALLPLTP